MGKEANGEMGLLQRWQLYTNNDKQVLLVAQKNASVDDPEAGSLVRRSRPTPNGKDAEFVFKQATPRQKVLA